MTWRCYLTIFRAESPIHIGYKQVGILKTTRHYITGRAMWGAITANLTRALFDNPNAENYRAVGKYVRGYIKTTYFYPALKGSDDLGDYRTENYTVFLPKYGKNGINYGSKSKEWFEQTFVDSLLSTALEPQTKSAEEGSLHEFEYIRNKINLAGESVQVYWLGYVFLKEESTKVEVNDGKKAYEVSVSRGNGDFKITFKNEKTENQAFLKKDVFNLLFVGGERNYGFGRLILEPSNFKLENRELFGKFKLRLDDDKIVIEIESNGDSKDIAPAHVDIEGIELKERFLGDIEPLVGLEWSERGAGQKVSKHAICTVPGSVLKSSMSCCIDDYGVLKTCSKT